jgi:hypothetical protein
MPITPFLVGQAFEPEAIESMSAAFVAACDTLLLKVRDDPATRIVAEKVIEFAQRGIRDPEMLRKLTLLEFGLSDDTIVIPQPATIGAALKYRVASVCRGSNCDLVASSRHSRCYPTTGDPKSSAEGFDLTDRTTEASITRGLTDRGLSASRH